MTSEVMAVALLGLSMVGCLYLLGAAVMTLSFERHDPPLPSTPIGQNLPHSCATDRVD